MTHPSIPPAVKIFTCLLIAAGLFFAYVFMFNPGLAFHGAMIDGYSSQLGFYSTAVRVLGSVFALLISLWLNRADLLAITLASRLFIEIGDVVVGFVTHGALVNNLMVSIIAVLELWALMRLWHVLKKSG